MTYLLSVKFSSWFSIVFSILIGQFMSTCSHSTALLSLMVKCSFQIVAFILVSFYKIYYHVQWMVSSAWMVISSIIKSSSLNNLLFDCYLATLDYSWVLLNHLFINKTQHGSTHQQFQFIYLYLLYWRIDLWDFSWTAAILYFLRLVL